MNCAEKLLEPSLPGKALRTLVDIARLAEILRILGEFLLISSLPGKALRTLVDIARLFQFKFNNELKVKLFYYTK